MPTMTTCKQKVEATSKADVDIHIGRSECGCAGAASTLPRSAHREMENYSHLKTAGELKDEGNAAFRAGQLGVAVEKYRAALRKAKRDAAATDEMRGTLLCNQAVCLVKLARWEEAVEAASAVRGVMSLRGRLGRQLRL